MSAEFFREHRIGGGIGGVGGGRDPQIQPGRKQKQGVDLRFARRSAEHAKAGSKPAARRIAADDQRSISNFGAQRFQTLVSIDQPGGEGAFGCEAVLRHDHLNAAAIDQGFRKQALKLGAPDAKAAAVELEHIAARLALGRKTKAAPPGERCFLRRLFGFPNACIHCRLHLSASFGEIRIGEAAGAEGGNFHSAATCIAIELSRLFAVRFAPMRFSSGMT